MKKLLLMGAIALAVSQSAWAVDCQNAQPYRAGNSYQIGDLVTYKNQTYTCRVAGWCSSTSSFYYAPADGLAWQEAWSTASCDNGTQPTPTPTPTPVPTPTPTPVPTPTPTPTPTPEEVGQSHAVEWILDSAKSNLHFVTTKKEHVSENQHFTEMSGDLTSTGELRFSVPLASVDTGIEIRDQRLRDLLFETNLLPSLQVSANLGANFLAGLAIGELQSLTLDAQIKLHGVSQNVSAPITLWRISAKEIRAFSDGPLLLDAANFAMAQGIEMLRDIAGLASIGNQVPVYLDTRWQLQPGERDAWAATPAQPLSSRVEFNAQTASLLLQWADMSVNETAYLVQSQRDGGYWKTEAELPANSQQHSIALDSAQTLALRVLAVNGDSPSALSPEVSISVSAADLGIDETPDEIPDGGTDLTSTGAQLYQEKECQACHGADGTELVSLLDRPMSQSALADYVDQNMPFGNASACVGDCADAVAAYIVANIYTGSDNGGGSGDGADNGSANGSGNGSGGDSGDGSGSDSDNGSDSGGGTETGDGTDTETETEIEPDATLGAQFYRDQGCSNCHGTDGNTGREIISNQRSQAALASYISANMPLGGSGNCVDDCAVHVAAYIRENLYQGEVAEAAIGRGVRGIRLLTPYEFKNTVFDLTGVLLADDVLPKAHHDDDFKYPTQSAKGLVNYAGASRYMQLAEQIAASANLTKLGCSASACTDAQLANAAEKLWRRSLTAAEQATQVQFYNSYGARDWLASMLLAPDFLYRSELGEWSADEQAYVLTSYEVATALSYQLWGTTPDAALLAAARSNSLQTSDAIGAKAEAMMADARFAQHFVDFIRYYTHTDGLPSEKTNLSSALIAAMEGEQERAVAFLLSEGSGSFAELFNPGYSFVNGTLASHYGIVGVTGSSFTKVATSDQRGGLLHQGFTQIMNSDFAATSLVKRGKMIRENLLCHDMGVPVGIDPATIEMPEHAITTRERWNVITGPDASEGQCWQCHKLMNEPGSALENFDQTGRYRSTEIAYNAPSVELAINASGILRSNDGDNELTYFNDARELTSFLAQSSEAKACFADSYYRYSAGHRVDAAVIAVGDEQADAFIASGNIKALVKSTLTSTAFQFRVDR
ncbi:DUF1588 domain-containing protein [Simiduia curdlanivorans]|uniref:DUF1592 domain-containing protein n=1 Tax=Simiduia curdlanivorans TaxID=1492769 RepID=A0ABV8V2X1_9GAMM|nr:DUF1592 domain-containing protein [Simiduia curdlanivorans]MDN3637648.1 DUF1588 domain-containing protein [Simiduia curdlanivorans]